MKPPDNNDPTTHKMMQKLLINGGGNDAETDDHRDNPGKSTQQNLGAILSLSCCL